MPRTVKLLANAHSEVKFALNFAIRRNFTHRVNFTIADNFTCPKGKLSFSVFSVKDNTLMHSLFYIILFLQSERLSFGNTETGKASLARFAVGAGKVAPGLIHRKDHRIQSQLAAVG